MPIHKNNIYINSLTAAAIFRKLAKKKKTTRWFFYMSEYEITRSLTPWKGMQSTCYLIVGSQRVNILYEWLTKIKWKKIKKNKFNKSLHSLKLKVLHEKIYQVFVFFFFFDIQTLARHTTLMVLWMQNWFLFFFF